MDLKDFVRENTYQGIKRGDVFYADLSPVVGSEQGGLRPVVVIQNDIGNKFSTTIIVAAISKQIKNNMPTHIFVDTKKGSPLPRNSVVMLEQVRTIDKQRLKEKLGTLKAECMTEIDRAIKISLGLAV